MWCGVVWYVWCGVMWYGVVVWCGMVITYCILLHRKKAAHRQRAASNYSEAIRKITFFQEGLMALIHTLPQSNAGTYVRVAHADGLVLICRRCSLSVDESSLACLEHKWHPGKIVDVIAVLQAKLGFFMSQLEQQQEYKVGNLNIRTSKLRL